MYKLGIDIGSTTIKCVLLHEGEVIYQTYERHFSRIQEHIIKLLETIQQTYPSLACLPIAISGSAGMGFAQEFGIDFIQEVYASKVAIETFLPSADVVIELGGEDAKILLFNQGMEVRMNGTCAGGTGAFIDQMAALLDLKIEEMNTLAKQHEKLYSIASRCGVFAKSDVQPLLNQGAKKSDLCASIFYAVVNQTIAGLAQGRPLNGNVVYLGGPLTFVSSLRDAFDDVLKNQGVLPAHSLYYVSMGTALSAEKEVHLQTMITGLKREKIEQGYAKCDVLFEDEAAYEAFVKRHSRADVKRNENRAYDGDAYLGIDAGSTTAKVVVLDDQGHLLFSDYQSNKGNPVTLLKKTLLRFYEEYPHAVLRSSCVTGYGEEMLKSAFALDFGIVETMAHFQAAQAFQKEVDFIIDIGGQDIKCFKVEDGAIDDIFLNEACSSGCGSFLQSFASALGYRMEEFAKLGLFAKAPVDLGTRCTVFMNSSVKQAQKDGASVENISAGLSISVVKNALYKVIRTSDASTLGKHIVVQGGTFLNDAVLRAFENEIQAEVVRPVISGLMGAYGCALYAKNNAKETTSILDQAALEAFEHQVQTTNCQACANHCSLTINTFDQSRRFIGGNRCDKPTSKQAKAKANNLYAYKRELLMTYQDHEIDPNKKIIGLPLGLNMYELLPFWYTFFHELGYQVKTTSFSNHQLYTSGQHTIPSDTVCYPAKLLHGHVEQLVKAKVDTIFYPCLTYNLDEQKGDNHYNCPVVAYYPEVIAANVEAVEQVEYIYEYLGIHRPKDLKKRLYTLFGQQHSKKALEKAIDQAYLAYQDYMRNVQRQGQWIIEEARKAKEPIVVLAGRPYHLDPGINHGIDLLISSSGAAIVSEDAIAYQVPKLQLNVLNQWTYHSRLYHAAKMTTAHKDLHFIQLVSFGCGLDAVTSDEVRSILRHEKDLCTQIKIDEITNLGTVKIRLRSLFSTLEARERANES